MNHLREQWRMAAKRGDDAAGLIERRKARTTGTIVGLYDGEPAGMDTEGGRWQTVCETHGNVISHQTKAVAQSFLSHPEEWCDECTKQKYGDDAP